MATCVDLVLLRLPQPNVDYEEEVVVEKGAVLVLNVGTGGWYRMLVQEAGTCWVVGGKLWMVG